MFHQTVAGGKNVFAVQQAVFFNLFGFVDVLHCSFVVPICNVCGWQNNSADCIRMFYPRFATMWYVNHAMLYVSTAISCVNIPLSIGKLAKTHIITSKLPFKILFWVVFAVLSISKTILSFDKTILLIGKRVM
jgi:hypothetical protein